MLYLLFLFLFSCLCAHNKNKKEKKDKVKDDRSDYSEEQGESFHQVVKLFEKHYKGQCIEGMRTTFETFCGKVS